MSKRRLVALLSLCLLIVIVTVVALILHKNHRAEVARIEAEESDMLRIAGAYYRLHSALGWTPEELSDEGFEIFFRDKNLRYSWLRNDIYYISIQSVSSSGQYFGDECITAYVNLKLYEHRTGNILPYERIVEYLSEEFESDGSLRLYNNGKHPDVESFVNWSSGRREEQLEYIESLRMLLFWYFEDYAGNDFERRSIRELSPQMLDALARAEADPTYVLDLTSLYRQGY